MNVEGTGLTAGNTYSSALSLRNAQFPFCFLDYLLLTQYVACCLGTQWIRIKIALCY